MPSKKDNQNLIKRSPGTDNSMDVLVRSIYEVALDPGHIREVLGDIRTHLGASAFSMFNLDGSPGHPAVTTDGLSDSWLNDYETHWWQHDVWVQSAHQQNLITGGTTVIGAQLIERRDLIKTPWHNEGLAPNNIGDVLCTSLWQEGVPSPRMALSFYRPLESVDFGDQERQLLGRLATHLTQALKFAETLDLFHQNKAINDALMNNTPHAVFLLSKDKRILFMNPVAEASLQQGSIQVGLKNERLLTVGLNSAPSLDEAFQWVDRGLMAPMVFIAGHGPLGPRMGSAKLLPISDRAGASLHHAFPRYLLIVDTQPPHDERALHLFGCLFKLTTAEQRILREILEDKSPSNIAETLGTTLPTVRTHIQRILQKTGVRRITDLVHRVSQIRLSL